MRPFDPDQFEADLKAMNWPRFSDGLDQSSPSRIMKHDLEAVLRPLLRPLQSLSPTLIYDTVSGAVASKIEIQEIYLGESDSQMSVDFLELRAPGPGANSLKENSQQPDYI
ncbi:hypothetical protein KM043_017077 [Ampulex compressa]|nr:hypothetical protein KM043_017077 [Ampulex compressa]